MALRCATIVVDLDRGYTHPNTQRDTDANKETCRDTNIQAYTPLEFGARKPGARGSGLGARSSDFGARSSGLGASMHTILQTNDSASHMQMSIYFQKWPSTGQKKNDMTFKGADIQTTL